jgi:hypothetical protein
VNKQQGSRRPSFFYIPVLTLSSLSVGRRGLRPLVLLGSSVFVLTAAAFEPSPGPKTSLTRRLGGY